MTTKNTTKDDISHLASLAYDAIRPVPGNDKPYAVERVFRESVKAVKESNQFRVDADEAALLVAGRLQKLPGRSNQVYRVPEEKSEHGGHLNDRIDRYAEAFAEKLLVDRCDGKPSLLKRRANNFADGFYAATIRLQYQSSDDSTDTETTAKNDNDATLNDYQN
ncbi:type I-D CRISPR-associated protein Cas10d/Csc3 [Natronococcus wangiae]|uniref:type I-D CRISPR-associated protein Cas10d/Csc3 n=1 Tax=Natronococcus wangiae TaxID=3068275 RepID=UPI00273D27BB|nr:type I-D CRISPR-associated protein Cas10d/Csc3 [Natronococcus sp. AD5]